MTASVEVSQVDKLRGLYEVMGRVNSSGDLDAALEQVVRGVVDVLGYGIAAIAQLQGDHFVMTNVAGSDEAAREQILGRRTPVSQIFSEFRAADEWGILRFVPHHRMPVIPENYWIPDIEVTDDPLAWHPLNTLYAPLYSPTRELLGNMVVDLPPNGRVPVQGDRELLEMFVVQAGVAMFNARQRERLAEQVRLAEAVRAVVTATGDLLDIDEVFLATRDPLIRGLRLTSLWAVAFPEDSQSAKHVLTKPGYQGVASGSELLDRVKAAAAKAWLRGRPGLFSLDEIGLVPNGQWGPTGPDGEVSAEMLAVRAALGENGIQRLLLVPIGAGPEVLGALALLRAAGDPEWSAEDCEAAMMIGSELGRTALHSRLFQTERFLIEQLQDLAVYKSELIATIAHELKSPLTSIVGHVELLEESESRQSVKSIDRNVGRMQTLIDDLLQLAQLERVTTEPERVLVDLHDLCVGSVDMLRVQAERGGTTLRLRKPAQPMLVEADPKQLTRVLDNLIGNALKYTESGGLVTVSLSSTADRVLASVTDTGMGVSAADLQTLFAVFDRSSNPHAHALPGTGLGLPIAKRIVELHQGEITVQSEPGLGSTFTVVLPAAGHAHTQTLAVRAG